MILQCPACEASYNVPDHAIGANGRNVRCKKCAHEWFARSADPVLKDDDVTLAALEKATEASPVAPTVTATKKAAKIKKARAPQPPAKPTLILTGALAASLFLAILTTLLAYKPGFFGFGKTIGLAMSDIKLAKQETETGMEYAVSGNLINQSTQPQHPPAIRITLVDKTGTALRFWEPSMPDTISGATELPFSFGPLKTSLTTADRMVVELGNSLELALRKKP